MKRFIFLLSFILSISAEASVIKVERADASLFSQQDCEYIICGKLDFKGKTIRLPHGVTLSFDEGRICNATIVGDDTWINAGLERVFDKVFFDGSFRNLFF